MKKGKMDLGACATFEDFCDVLDDKDVLEDMGSSKEKSSLTSFGTTYNENKKST